MKFLKLIERFVYTLSVGADGHYTFTENQCRHARVRSTAHLPPSINTYICQDKKHRRQTQQKNISYKIFITVVTQLNFPSYTYSVHFIYGCLPEGCKRIGSPCGKVLRGISEPPARPQLAVKQFYTYIKEQKTDYLLRSVTG